jgi:hypothetical protein
MDGSLPQDIEIEMRKHLKACGGCREIYEREVQFSASLKNVLDLKISSLEIDESMIFRLKDAKKEKKPKVFAGRWTDFILKPIILWSAVLIIFLSVFVIHSPKLGDDKTIWLNDREEVFDLEEDLMLTDPRADWFERRLIITIVDEKQKRYGKIITSKNPEKTIMYWEKMEEKK